MFAENEASLINILLKKYLKNLNMHIYNIITYVIL